MGSSSRTLGASSLTSTCFSFFPDFFYIRPPRSYTNNYRLHRWVQLLVTGLAVILIILSWTLLMTKRGNHYRSTQMIWCSLKTSKTMLNLPNQHLFPNPPPKHPQRSRRVAQFRKIYWCKMTSPITTLLMHNIQANPVALDRRRKRSSGSLVATIVRTVRSCLS